MKLPEPSSGWCLFPLYHWKQVPATAVQTACRTLFARWGLPQRIRVDNGDPWSTWSDLPPALALWWVGLGITPVWNHPGRPTENARVERCHGLVDRWGEPQRCPDWEAWTERLAWLARVQREEYPACGGPSRLTLHPELCQNPRRYPAEAAAPVAAAPVAAEPVAAEPVAAEPVAAEPVAAEPVAAEPEGEGFELRRVRDFVAQGRWPRRVSKTGQVTLYGQPYRVGRKWAGQQVWVRLEAGSNEWVIQSESGEEVRRHPASQLTAERIVGLQVAHPRPPSRKRAMRQNLPAPPAA